MGKLNWWFFTEDDDLSEKYNTLCSVIKSLLISENNLIASLSTTFFFSKTKIKSHDDQLTVFCDKEIPKLDSNHTSLKVIC